MGKVVTAATVSLDGYIAGPNESGFEPLAAAPLVLDGPTLVVEGARVTHLRYTVRRS